MGLSWLEGRVVVSWYNAVSSIEFRSKPGDRVFFMINKSKVVCVLLTWNVARVAQTVPKGSVGGIATRILN